MTLILAFANTQHAALVSDRRFTNSMGYFDDEKNKATALLCVDGRAAIAFSGLAEIPGRFRTAEWLLDALADASKPHCMIEPTIRSFVNRATSDIVKLPIDDNLKALTFVFVGFKFDEVPPRCYYWKVTNLETKDDHSKPVSRFQCYSEREDRPAPGEPSYLVLAAGRRAALTGCHWNELVAFVRDRKPAQAQVSKAVEIIRQAADSPLSGGTIGKQCDSIVLPRDPTQSAVSAYHSDVISFKSYAPNQVVCAGENGTFEIKDFVVKVRDSLGRPKPVAVPKVKRNHPCPCGSGKKYKKCHGAVA